LAQRPGIAETVDQGKQMPVPLVDEVADQREAERVLIGEVELHLVMAAFEHVMKGGAAPILGGFAIGRRELFKRIALVAGTVVPAEAAPLIDRMQRVDEGHAARQMQTAVAATLAEAANQLGFGKTCETLAHQPVHQVETGGQFHGINYAAQSRWVKAPSMVL